MSHGFYCQAENAGLRLLGWKGEPYEGQSREQLVYLAAFLAARWPSCIYERRNSILTFETVISDPNDPKFDLEGYLTALMGEKAK